MTGGCGLFEGGVGETRPVPRKQWHRETVDGDGSSVESPDQRIVQAGCVPAAAGFAETIRSVAVLGAAADVMGLAGLVGAAVLAAAAGSGAGATAWGRRGV